MFHDLDERAKADFCHYVRQDRLVVTVEASWVSGGSPKVTYYGFREGIQEFAEFFERYDNKASANELTEIYSRLQSVWDLPNVRSKEERYNALRAHEDAHPSDRILLKSSDTFYGASKGVHLWSQHVQWLYIPAVKDASEEQAESKSSALGRLLQRTIRARIDFGSKVAAIRQSAASEYAEMMTANQQALQDLSASLSNRIGTWAHPGASMKVEWRADTERSIRVDEPLAHLLAGEGAFESDIARFGHGLQRSILLALLQELASAHDTISPTLILSIEEPELYQHPPQARHLSNVLQSLSEENAQVLVCTHSPYFISGNGFADVRVIRKEPSGAATVYVASPADVEAEYVRALGRLQRPTLPGSIARIHQALQPELNEMFFASMVILVEGLEDAAYVTTYMHLLNLWDSEFRRLGCHIVAVGGKEHLLRPLAMARHLHIPVYTIFDSDGLKYVSSTPGYSEHQERTRESRRKQHGDENVAIQRLNGVASPLPFHAEHIWSDSYTMWSDDITTAVDSDLASAEYDAILNSVRSSYGSLPNLKKNSLFISEVIAECYAAGIRSPALERLCFDVIKFASSHSIRQPLPPITPK